MYTIKMAKIVPYLWFDKEAMEAADYYTQLFDDSKITSSYILEDTPSGETPIVNFQLAGQAFSAISAGPYFKFNPSLSLMVQCSTIEEVERLWNMLITGGKEVMSLDDYPFSKRYGWLEDRYGLSWQIALVEQSISQKIIPHFLFSNGVNEKTEEAITFYTRLFPNSSIEDIHHYQPGDSENEIAKVMFSSFNLNGMKFNAMDNAYESDFTFNEAFSLEVLCKDQQEIDYYWNKLSSVPEAEQCGWVKDPYGVSWQIVPEGLDNLLETGSREQINRVTQRLLKMKKLDMAELEKAKYSDI